MLPLSIADIRHNYSLETAEQHIHFMIFAAILSVAAKRRVLLLPGIDPLYLTSESLTAAPAYKYTNKKSSSLYT
jgi:hypothetical protein